MTQRSEIQRLLIEARALPADVCELRGADDLIAVLEPSAGGKARMVRVLRGGGPVSWMFSVEAGEVQPDFYPSDLPFLDRMSAVLMWDEEAGLHVQWMMTGFKEQIGELRDRVSRIDMSTLPAEVSELAEKVREATAAERKERLRELRLEDDSPVMEWVRGVFGDVPTRLPDEVVQATEEILRFHERGGWTVVEEGPGAAQRRAEMRKGPATRHLQVVSVLGLTTIRLSQPPGVVDSSADPASS